MIVISVYCRFANCVVELFAVFCCTSIVKMTNIKKNSDETKPSLLKQAALQIIAGGSAGFVEVCMHPLDLVKTRLQIQNKSTTNPGKTVNQVCAMYIVILT